MGHREKGSIWGGGHGLTLTPSRRAPLRQGAAAEDRGGQGTSCDTRVCRRLTGHGRQTDSCFSFYFLFLGVQFMLGQRLPSTCL